MLKLHRFLFVTMVCALTLYATCAMAAEDLEKSRDKANLEYRNGNYKDAYEIFRKLSLNKDNDITQVPADYNMGVSCLQSLGQYKDFDSFRNEVVEAHPDNWRLFQAAARSLFNAHHYGTIIAGEFERGYQRGGGRYVNTIERDRVEALGLMSKGLVALEAGKGKKGGLVRAVIGTNHSEVSGFYMEFARMLVGYRGYQESWRLQYNTDFSDLPDYEDGYGYYNSGVMGAPVDAEGNPVFHKLPESYELAASDGERWRYFLRRAMDVYPINKNSIKQEYAAFLYNQFGVQTLAYFGRQYAGFGSDEAGDNDSGTYALYTLEENETIARLATGIKRFKLPDDANFLKIYREIGQDSTVAQIFENRRQYPKAAKLWKKTGNTGRYNQIVKNWGQFQPVSTHPSGQGATVEFRFRNGTEVSFKAHKIHLRKLLKDVKGYIKSNPRNLDWNKMNIGDLGHRLVNQDEARYKGAEVASWNLDVEPRGKHFDKIVTVETPLKKAGVYLLTATMGDGNVSNIIIWLDNTAIVKKQLDNKAYFYIGDSVTGKPLPDTAVEFFGYRQEYVGGKWPNQDRYKIYTKKFSRRSGKRGQITLTPNEYDQRYTWLVTVDDRETRLAYLGFTGVWYSNYYDNEYNQTKIFTVTDRPVYRPNQKVNYKIWVRHAKYDQEDTSAFAGKSFTVRVNNPKGEKIYELSLKADAFGGINGDFMLPDDAALGSYYVYVVGYGGTSFRVEEYKKPEFEVTVEAPTEPIMLGEKIEAKIIAKYYFGSPVTKGKVKYKVLRSNYSSRWYPVSLWDWFYGPGYWWFAYDYTWWPGWHHWGCYRPVWWWWNTPAQPPEVVAEAEVAIGKDGTLRIPIDTQLAKELHGNTDHRYQITAEVRDESRRTIVGQGTVLVARQPFKVYAWVDRGHYRVGDVVHASFSAQTLDHKGVEGAGELTLFRVSYNKQMEPVETAVKQWSLATDAQGRSSLQLKASRAGQYRLSYQVTDSKEHTIEGGYVFVVRGDGFDGKNFRFSEIELVPDKKEYAPGEKVGLMVNTDRSGATVVLFIRPANGIYKMPKVMTLDGKSGVHKIAVTKKDMPNFFVEAFTVYNGKIYSDTREIIVPPEKRVINVEVVPDKTEYKPGEKARIRVKLTDLKGKPFIGSTVMTVYDKAVEYISGGSNVPAIRPFFWKWRRSHYPRTESSLQRSFYNVISSGNQAMQFLGVFGHLIQAQTETTTVSDGAIMDESAPVSLSSRRGDSGKMRMAKMKAPARSAPMGGMKNGLAEQKVAEKPADDAGRDAPGGAEAMVDVVQPTVRSKFADTAFWAAALETDKEGIADIEFDMPENLTGWKIKTWAMGHGTKVGESTVDVVTRKSLLLRLQAPRFFVETDEVVLSANIHNYLDSAKQVTAVLEVDGANIELMEDAQQKLTIEAVGEQRVDWRVKVVREGEVTIRMKALTDEESDAMQMQFPVYVHGMLKTDSYSGVIRPQGKQATIKLSVPSERRPEQTRLEIRYSPTLAAAMVDALPYLVEYPYGCTEQTLNRFLPTVITQKVLKDMGVDLADIQEKRTNLNAQEIGNDQDRAKQWKRWDRNPVFSERKVNRMVRKGTFRLQSMQLSDGGWGWFSGWGEYSYPHTTAYVVHGLQIAKENGVNVDNGVLSRGIAWLERYEQEQIRLIKRAKKKTIPYKTHADNLDAFIYMVLGDAGQHSKEMRDFLYRDRTHLAVYGKAMFGVALHKQDYIKKRDMIIRNIEQFLKIDDENQTAYLELQNTGYWWYWYGSEYEAQAYYLKLLAVAKPQSKQAAGLVKYLLNNRKHATYWNSTRDTALVVEAFADYLRATGEDKPDMTVDIYVDDEKKKSVKISGENLFTFDNKLVIEGLELSSGEHTVKIVRSGKGPVYFNAYLTNFTLEDFITKAGLEIKVQREYYKLVRVDKTIKAAGSRGQALDQKVEKYKREKLENWATLTSGDMVEIELEIDSKNDYEYIIFEDMKAAGFEPVQVRSGYSDNKGMHAYREFRDEKVCFFVRALARGKHSMAYRMRAEIPGKFSALPTKAYAMYAPELKGNSDEIKIEIVDD
jgi:alpha-2-macroglobulin